MTPLSFSVCDLEHFLGKISKYPNFFFCPTTILISDVFAVILSKALKLTIVLLVIIFFTLFDLILVPISVSSFSSTSVSSSKVGSRFSRIKLS